MEKLVRSWNQGFIKNMKITYVKLCINTERFSNEEISLGSITLDSKPLDMKLKMETL